MQVGVLHKHERLLDHIPVVDENEHRYRNYRALAERNVYPCEYLELARTVELCCFDIGNRYALHHLRQQEYAERREYARQDDRPAHIRDRLVHLVRYHIGSCGNYRSGVVLDEVGNEKVRDERYLIRHYQQYYVSKEYYRLELVRIPRKAVCCEYRKQHLKYCYRDSEYHRVPEFQQVIGAFQQHAGILVECYLVGDELEVDVLGYERFFVVGHIAYHRAVVGGYLVRCHKRVCNGQHRRHQEEYRGYPGEHHYNDVEDPLFGMSAHQLSTSFPNISSAIRSMAMMTIITSEKSTAADESF